MATPKKRPTALTVFMGNPGKRKLNQHEPMPSGGIGACPDDLPAPCEKHWDAIVASCPAGMLTPLERPLLKAYVMACHLYDLAIADVRKGGITCHSSEGNEYQAPALAIANKQALLIQRIGADLGFNPSARTKISVPQGDDGDGVDRFFS